jgi:MFS family permease
VTDAAGEAPPRSLLRPWHFVIAFGIVSLLADMVYEGARSIIGPYLATLGASATVVGVVAGAGEFIGYGLRVVSGYAVRRTRHYWTWTILGYALTVLSVPLIGVTGVLAPALLLVRHRAAREGGALTGQGHPALPRVGPHRPRQRVRRPPGPRPDRRDARPTAARRGTGLARRRLPPRVRRPRDPRRAGPRAVVLAAAPGTRPGRLRAQRATDTCRRRCGSRQGRGCGAWEPARPVLAAAIAVLSCGIVSFPLLAYHAQTNGLLTDAQVPILFAVAMFVDGTSGLVMGRIYDLRGPFTLLAVPVAAAASVLAFSQTVLWIWVGVAIWGVVNGVLDSTVKAVVTELVPSSSRAVAFGWLAFVRGAGLLIAGGLLGAAYDQSTSLAVGLVLAANLLALGGLAGILRTLDRRQR